MELVFPGQADPAVHLNCILDESDCRVAYVGLCYARKRGRGWVVSI